VASHRALAGLPLEDVASVLRAVAGDSPESLARGLERLHAQPSFARLEGAGEAVLASVGITASAFASRFQRACVQAVHAR